MSRQAVRTGEDWAASKMLGRRKKKISTEPSCPSTPADPEEIEQRVLARMLEQRPSARNVAEAARAESSFGDRLADRVAAAGGSWSFMISFSLVLVGWMMLNTDVLAHWGLAFDPYPYTFLNLMLSMVAALQAPVIMMSQNRQGAKDRLAARLDYEVNLRCELEMIRLHEKIDTAVLNHLAEILETIRREVECPPGGR